MLDFGIVDSHVHFWDPQRLRYTWLDGIEALNRPFLPADFDKACGAVHVEKIVFVQGDCLPTQSRDEVAWVSSLAERDPRIAGIVAFAPLERGAGAREALASLAKNRLVKGVRRLLQSEADVRFCLQPDFLAGVALLAEFGLSFDICIKHPQLAASIEMVRRVPQVKFVLDHIGKPDIKGQQFEPWKAEIRELSKLPNVCCKVSGLVTEADHDHWRSSDLKPYIDHVLGAFGPDRVLFGSDWPVVQLASTYTRWVETLLDAVAVSPAEQRKLFRENAITWYRLA